MICFSQSQPDNVDPAEEFLLTGQALKDKYGDDRIQMTMGHGVLAILYLDENISPPICPNCGSNEPGGELS